MIIMCHRKECPYIAAGHCVMSAGHFIAHGCYLARAERKEKTTVKWDEMTEAAKNVAVATAVMGWRMIDISMGPVKVSAEHSDDGIEATIKYEKITITPAGNIERVPNFCGDIKEAWGVLQKIRHEMFSVRRKFGDHLQDVISCRYTESRVAWPDALFFMEPEDICIAALAAKGYEFNSLPWKNDKS